MKLLSTLCVASAIALGTAGAASAASIQSVSPTNTSLTATGPMFILNGGASLTCVATLTGTINNTTGTAQITGASFTGSSGICSVITAGFLPQLTALSTTSVGGAWLSLNTPIGACSAAPPSGPWDNTLKTWKTTGAVLAPCTITFSLTTPNMKVI